MHYMTVVHNVDTSLFSCLGFYIYKPAMQACMQEGVSVSCLTVHPAMIWTSKMLCVAMGIITNSSCMVAANLQTNLAV